MLDKIFALAAFATLVWFMYTVVSIVAEPDLWVLGIMFTAVAGYFLWREIAAGGSHLEGDKVEDVHENQLPPGT